MHRICFGHVLGPQAHGPPMPPYGLVALSPALPVWVTNDGRRATEAPNPPMKIPYIRLRVRVSSIPRLIHGNIAFQTVIMPFGLIFRDGCAAAASPYHHHHLLGQRTLRVFIRKTYPKAFGMCQMLFATGGIRLLLAIRKLGTHRPLKCTC